MEDCVLFQIHNPIEKLRQMKNQKIVVFDTTLRDGEQCPGASMTLRQKLEVARRLAALKVDVIEAGFPVISPGDFEAVQAIAKTIKGPIICALARCVEKDIDEAGRALQAAGSLGRIHVFVGTSPEHRSCLGRGKSMDEVVSMAVAGVKRARSYVSDVEFSAMDATRTEPDFLLRICAAAIGAGATTINIPDTVGLMLPNHMFDLVAYIRRSIPEISSGPVKLSVHCHNDLGLAVANSVASLQAGADQVECTVNGIGERAGNAALEEVVMAIKKHPNAFDGRHTAVVTTEILKASRLVARMSGLFVQRSKAVVGDNAFAHASGIHQDGVLKKRESFEILDPREVGWGETSLPLTKHSGRAAVASRLKHLGFKLTDQDVTAVFDRFKSIGDAKKFVSDDDITALVENHMGQVSEAWSLAIVQVSSGTGQVPTATVRLKRAANGVPETSLQDASVGDGPVDAVLKAIDRITNIHGRLCEYSVRGVTGGKDALAQAQVEVDFGTKRKPILIKGVAAATDTIEASARAYLSAVNRFLKRSSLNHKGL
jgi:2-isopropylmalate synthase